MSREAFVADSLVVDAVIRNLTIIGEAVKQLPETVRQLDDDIPWSLIARFRSSNSASACYATTPA